MATANVTIGHWPAAPRCGSIRRMTSIRFSRPALALAVIALLLAASPGQARHRQAAAAEPGAFDYFLLSLSVAPSFCALSPANRAKDECRTITEADFDATPLTVHGLWPNRARVGVRRQPQDCQGPPLGTLPDTLQAELRRAMPGGPELEAHEWSRHGTCSGLTPEAYFATVVRLAQHANEVIGPAIHAQGAAGHEVRISDLLAAVAAHDPALSPAIVVNCRFPRGGGEALIDEVRVVLSKDLAPMPAASVGLGQNSGCPKGAGFVPGVANPP